MDEVTVVIALYNKKKYIQHCVESVLDQTYTNFTLLIIDDGSTDGSVEIVEQIKDFRIRIIKQKNSGPGHARNKGIEHCKTPYITFIDADDTWEPDFLSTAFHALQNFPNCDLFLCGASWLPLGEKRLPVLSSEIDFKTGKWSLPNTLRSMEIYEAMNLFATGAVMIKTEIAKKYGGYFSKERCNSGEDAYLWIQVMFNHSIYREMQYLLTVNTEGSDLGIGRKTLKPVPPYLKYPDILFKNCPEKHLSSLQKLLNLTAFMAFRRELYQIHFLSAFRLLKKFPDLITEKPSDYPPVYLAFIIIPIKKYLWKIKNKILKYIKSRVANFF